MVVLEKAINEINIWIIFRDGNNWANKVTILNPSVLIGWRSRYLY